MGRDYKAKGVSTDIAPSVTDLSSEEEPDVLICSLRDVDLIIEGISGQGYRFPRAGVVVKVKAVDAQYFLGLTRKGCCGGTVSRLFELVSGG